MAKDLSNLAPSAATQPAQVYGAPAPDPVKVALTWRLALERKATDADLLDEPAPFRNQIVQGALSWLQSYSGDFDYLLNLRSNLNPRRGLSERQACGVLNCMAAEYRRAKSALAAATPEILSEAERRFGPRTQAPVVPTRIQVEDAGVYRLPDGTICKVQVTRDKARTYAKRLTEIGGRRLTEAGTIVAAEYVYEAGLVQRVAAEGTKLTLAEAKALTIRYGFCIRCGRHLTDAKSVEQGMGPVCVRYFS